MTAQPDYIPVARPVIAEEDIEAAVRVLRSGMVVQGPEVAAFEAEFSAWVEGRHCVAVNSGTSALHLALLAMGVGPGDEVIVPSFSFAASANAVRLAGADVIFADIDPATHVMDPESVAALVSTRTAAVMPVHLYGLPAPLPQLTDIAARSGLGVIEDAAQAHGARIDGHSVGAWGTTGCFSFYPTKNMHSLEGGMITTADESMARTLRLLRNQGMEQRYANEIVGANLRLTDVAAAIGRQQLQRLAGWNKQRQHNAQVLSDGLVGVGTPVQPLGIDHVFHQYTIRVPNGRDALQAHLQSRGIGSTVYYPTPIHRLRPYLADDGAPDPRWDLPHTDQAASQVLSLPVYPSLRADELDRVIAAVNEWTESS